MLQGLRWTKATWIARQSLVAVSRNRREVLQNTIENTAATEQRVFCTKMNGSVIHDEQNKMFYVELTNDGGTDTPNYSEVFSYLTYVCDALNCWSSSPWAEQKIFMRILIKFIRMEL